MATTITGGIKNVSWVAAEGATAITTTGATGTVTKTGTNIDLASTAATMLPDEVWIKGSVSGTGTISAATNPQLQIFALWLTDTGTAGSPGANDKESHMVVNAQDTTTLATTMTGWTGLKPTNARTFTPKGRYMKLRYKLKNALGGSATIHFNAKLLKVHGQGYKA